MMELLKSNKQALFFLGKFIGLYMLLNFLYGAFIQFYYPLVDPFTLLVTNHTSTLLNLLGQKASTVSSLKSASVVITNKGSGVVNVYEGCNGLNVAIVYITFLFAYNNQFKVQLLYVFFGTLLIYLLNLFRVTALFAIAQTYPEYLYLFHKYILTGFLYATIFFIWYRFTRVRALK